MSQKKLVGRSVTIALGIICVILVVGIAGTIANYTSIISGKDNTISSQDSQILSLQTHYNQLLTWLYGNKTDYANQIADKDSQIVDLQTQIARLNSQIADLLRQIADLEDIVNLRKEEVVVNEKSVDQGAGVESVVVGRSYPYCGYLRISSTSTSQTAYITLRYWFEGTLYVDTKKVGTIGSVLFPILKTDSATVYVGNRDWGAGTHHTITVTYHY